MVPLVTKGDYPINDSDKVGLKHFGLNDIHQSRRNTLKSLVSAFLTFFTAKMLEGD